MPLVIRPAVLADAHAIATVRIDTWRAAYTGLIASEVLDRLDIAREADRRAQRWDEMHADPRATELVAELAGAVVGWAALGPDRDTPAGGDGELYAIYALPSVWSQGVGRALLAAAEEFLTDAGYAEAVLWHLDGNDRAARFYDRHGWTEDGASRIDDRLVGGVAAHALHERRRRRRLR